MKNLLLTVLAIIGLLFLLLNFIPIDCEGMRIISTLSPTSSHKVEISSRVCKETEKNGIYLSVEEFEGKKTHETKILNNTTNDIKYNWVTTNDINIVIPKNSKSLQGPGQMLGINYEFVYR